MAKCTKAGCTNECDGQLMKDQRCFECYLEWQNGDEVLKMEYGVEEDE